MNSRPPPCEGDALPAELLPHMDATTRRSEVCMPFTCRGQVFFVNRPSVVRERRACCPCMQGPGSYEAGSGKRERHVHRSLRLFPKHPFLHMQVNELHLSRNAYGKARPLRSRLASRRPDRQDTGGILGPCRPAGNLHVTPDKARGIPGSSPSVHPLKKIGRAAPVGAWLPRKKTL